jgi:hypothetical protein
MLNAKTLKVTIVMEPTDILALNVPETGKAFKTQVRAGGGVIEVPLNAKSLRKTIAGVKAGGPENFVMVIAGKLHLGNPLTMIDAAVLAQPKKKQEAPAEPEAEQVAA